MKPQGRRQERKKAAAVANNVETRGTGRRREAHGNSRATVSFAIDIQHASSGGLELKPPCGKGFPTPLRGQGWVAQSEHGILAPTEYTTAPPPREGRGNPPRTEHTTQKIENCE